MRLIELLFASTAIFAVVNAAPTFEERGVVNADEPFDSKAFVFNPRKIKHTAGGRRRRGRKHVKRTGDCGSFGLDLNTNLKFGATGEPAAPPPPAALPAPPAPPPPPSPPSPPARNDRDTIIVNVDNKINH